MAEVVAALAFVAAAWVLGWVLHLVILRGLRAPRLRHAQGPADFGFAADATQSVRIAGPRGKRLFAWLVLPAGYAQGLSQPVPAVLVMHGWGANAAMMWPVVRPLHRAGFAVLLVDARCHGLSDDDTFTSMPRFAEDIAAGLEWLRAEPGIASNRLALLGHSVGAAAVLLHAAGHDDVRAAVSLSAFAHPREVMRRFMAERRVPYAVLGWCVLRHVQRVIGVSFDDIAPLSTLPRVRCPVLLVHGRADLTVPYGDVLHLHAAASGRAELLAVEGGHDLRDALAGDAERLVAFLRRSCAAAGAPVAVSDP